MVDTPRHQSQPSSNDHARRDAEGASDRAADTTKSLGHAAKDAADTAANATRDVADKAADTAETATRAGQENVDRGLNTVRDGVQRAGEATHRLTARSLEMGSQAVGAYMETGKHVSNAIGDVNKAATEAYTRSWSNYGELSRQAAQVRSVQDLVDLQTNALDKARDNFNAVTGVYGLFLTSFTKSMEPIVQRATDAARRREPVAA